MLICNLLGYDPIAHFVFCLSRYLHFVELDIPVPLFDFGVR